MSEMLHRYLNGDLDGAELEAFYRQLEGSPELQKALASMSLQDALVSELVLEDRPQRSAPRRSYAGAAAAAAVMLAGLWFLLAKGHPPVAQVVSGTAVVVRDGRETADAELRVGDRLRGQVVLQLREARVELQGEAVLEARGLHLDRGLLSVEGKTDLSTSLGTLQLSGAADLIAGTETRLEVRSGSARVGGTEIAAGRYAVLDAPARSGTLVGHARVNEAVRRGAAFLETRHRDLWLAMADGHRHGPAPRRSYGELALLAFHRAGYAADHPVVADLLGRTRTRPIESTYIAALQAMALSEIDPVEDRERIRDCARLLTQAQARNGQWDYGVAPGAASGDNSVSAYAALGLRACAEAGFTVDPSVLERARKWWISSQNPDGGWGYNDGVNPPSTSAPGENTGNTSYGSVTAGALAALASLGPDTASEAAIRKGSDWMAAHFAADRNPAKSPGFSQTHWYAACGRAGRLLRTESFGPHEWYPELAGALLSAQREDGAWQIERGDFMGRERNEILDTCLAILFLKR